MSRPTINQSQAKHDTAVVIAVITMAITAIVWLVTRFLSR